MASKVVLKKRGLYDTGRITLWPTKTGNGGIARVCLGGRAYSLTVFLQNGETKNGKPTAGWINLIDFGKDTGQGGKRYA
jgi:hypothetical protein